MQIKRRGTVWFLESKLTAQHPVPLTKGLFGIGWCWRWDKSVSPAGPNVYMFGPFTLAIIR